MTTQQITTTTTYGAVQIGRGTMRHPAMVHPEHGLIVRCTCPNTTGHRVGGPSIQFFKGEEGTCKRAASLTSTQQAQAKEDRDASQPQQDHQQEPTQATSRTTSKGKDVGYVRVSSIAQNTARQLEGVALDKTFTDKVSGKDTQRPQLAACLDYIREGDTLHVHSMDRLARNLDDLRKLVDTLTGKGVTVIFHKEGMTFEPITSDMDKSKADMARLMLSIMGAVAEFERSMILERQREGIAIAKAAGKYKGRKAALSGDRATELRQRAADGESKTKLAFEFGISRETLYKYLQAAPQ